MKVLVLLALLFSTTTALNCKGCIKEIGENVSHELVSELKGYDAIDFCLIVSSASSMATKHIWLQSFIPLLEDYLLDNDIGTSSPNRYCLVHFNGTQTGNFLKVNDGIFFRAREFVFARRQLQTGGSNHGDGYEAIQYALLNAPLRIDPRVGVSLLLVTDSIGSSNVTKQSVLNSLNGVQLNSVVDANLSHGNDIVLGLHNLSSGSIIINNGIDYQLVDNVTSTLLTSRYIDLAINSNGSVWSIDLLTQANLTLLTTFVRAFVGQNDIHKTSIVESCIECICIEMAVSGVCLRQICTEGNNQLQCFCLANNLCGNPVTEQPVPRPLIITGSVDQFPGGDIELTFESTINRANYECVLLNSDTPTLSSCSSPHYLKALSTGEHQLLIIGKRKHSLGTRLFEFVIEGDMPILTLEQYHTANNTITVQALTSGFKNEPIYFCSLDNSPFYSCGSNVLLSDVGLFIVVALEDKSTLAVASITVTRPTPLPTGNVMIGITRVDLPDPFGRIKIHYNTSRPDVDCVCRVNMTGYECRDNQYIADPRILGSGPNTVSIICMDSNYYIDTKLIKFNLILPPTPPPGPLSCQLNVTNTHRLLMANYICDRKVISTCQVSSLSVDSCVSPNYQVDISSLPPGPHVFILSLDDGFGKSLMKVVPFTIGIAHRKCCPVIGDNSNLSTSDNGVILMLDVDLGNCTLSEGFSYSIRWGDGATDNGMSSTLTQPTATHRYDNQQLYIIDIEYCNNPSQRDNICCDTLTLQTSS